MSNLHEAQAAVLLLLDHFGIKTTGISSVTISAEKSYPVEIDVQYRVYGSERERLEYERKIYHVSDNDGPEDRMGFIRKHFFEWVKL